MPHRKEPTVPKPRSISPTILGLDVHKNTISAAILRPGDDVSDVEKISSDNEAVRRLIARLGDSRRLRACYEAGPTALRAGAPVEGPGRGLRGDRPVVDPDRSGRPGHPDYYGGSPYR